MLQKLFITKLYKLFKADYDLLLRCIVYLNVVYINYQIHSPSIWHGASNDLLRLFLEYICVRKRDEKNWNYLVMKKNGWGSGDDGRRRKCMDEFWMDCSGGMRRRKVKKRREKKKVRVWDSCLPIPWRRVCCLGLQVQTRIRWETRASSFSCLVFWIRWAHIFEFTILPFILLYILIKDSCIMILLWFTIEKAYHYVYWKKSCSLFKFWVFLGGYHENENNEFHFFYF